jgi:hypothetical protein
MLSGEFAASPVRHLPCLQERVFTVSNLHNTACVLREIK